METAASSTLLALLADARHRAIISALGRSDMLASELTRLSGDTPEQLTVTLTPMQTLGLISVRRSDAGTGESYYHLDLDRLRELFWGAGATLHPALAPVPSVVETSPEAAALPRVLFLCTHNSARSQMAEGLLRHLSGGKVETFSAGNQPGPVHPLAIETMALMEVDISAQQSKHLDQFAGQPFDYVITVCDKAREVCPTFPGSYERIHWSFADPASQEDPGARERAFRSIAYEMMNRIRYLLIIMERRRRAAVAA